MPIRVTIMQYSRRWSVKRYNLGGGKNNIAGWVNVDIENGAEIRHDLGIFPWPFQDGEADELLASHIIEHFTKEQGWVFLKECHRIMKPGAILHIAVPDMDKFVYSRLKDDYSSVGNYFWRDMNYFLGGDTREKQEHMRHKYMYTFESLAYPLEKMGFDVRQRYTPLPIDNHEHTLISLYVDAIKI